MATHNPINILEAFAAAPPPLDYVLPNMVAGYGRGAGVARWCR